MRSLVLITCVAALACGSAPAWGQATNAPPGNSGIDEYLESVPEATGNRPSATVQPKAGKRGSLPEGNRIRLSKLGRDGRAAAELAGASGPESRETPAGGRRGADGERRGTGGEEPVNLSDGDGRLDALADAVRGGSSGGMGIVLPLVLVLALIGSLVLLIRRRLSS